MTPLSPTRVMSWCRCVATGLFLLNVLLGCTANQVQPMAFESPGTVPVMPTLKEVSVAGELAPVFGPSETFVGSPIQDVGHAGLFDVHEANSNEVALLQNGEHSFAVRVQLLEQAKKSIRIQAFIFSGDEAGLHIAEILKRKRAEGLDVRVIVDAASNLGLQTQWMYFDLKQHGIEVQGYESLYLEWLNEVPLPHLSPTQDSEAPNSRYHEKLWIVDGETNHGAAVVGGLNIANEYFRIDPVDPTEHWRDQDIIVKGRMVADIVTAFDRNFEHFLAIKESRLALNTDLYWKATRYVLDKIGKLDIPYEIRPNFAERTTILSSSSTALNYVDARGRFFHNRPRLGETYIWQAYRKLFENAKREILICNAYLIPSPDFIDAVRNAVGRGVRVVILTNSPATNDLTELTLVGRSYYERILSMNEKSWAMESGGSVQIWEWYGQRHDHAEQTEGTLHAKYAIFDRLYSLVGSYNLDPRSEKLNSETAVVVESKPLSTELAKTFYENDLAHSRRVLIEEAKEFKEPTDAIDNLRKHFGSIFESLL